MQNVELIEEEMGISAEARWNPESANWQSAAQYMKIREYQLAVDRLEGLVVSRLLELQKANIAGTCKRQVLPHGTHIDSALQVTNNGKPLVKPSRLVAKPSMLPYENTTTSPLPSTLLANSSR